MNERVDRGRGKNGRTEDTIVRPDVLVVSNEHSSGVGREGGLSSSRESEEEGDVSLDTLVGGGVEGQVSELDGLEEVLRNPSSARLTRGGDTGAHHQTEDTLLHLSGVLGTEDDHLLPLEVDLDGSLGGHSSGEPVGGELSSVVDDEVGLSELLELFGGGSDQHCEGVTAVSSQLEDEG
jgi:hypothetical protein